jgi:hypothetical protein
VLPRDKVVGLIHAGAGYGVDTWVAAVFKIGVVDDAKNLLLAHSRMKTLLKCNAG